MANFSSFFSNVTDPRGRQARVHILAEVLFVTFLAVMAGNNDAEAVVDFLKINLVWFWQFLSLPGGVFAHDRVLRTLAMVKSEEIELVRIHPPTRSFAEKLTVDYRVSSSAVGRIATEVARCERD